MLGGSQLKILLLKNVLNDVTTAPFLVSFSQLLAVKKDTKNGAVVMSLRAFLCRSTFNLFLFETLGRAFLFLGRAL